MKHKSPKALRKLKKRQWGIVIGAGLPVTVAGSLHFNQGNLVNDKSAEFTFFYDGAFQPGDKIMISGQREDRSNRIKYKKVHVARRRQSKGKSKPIIYEIDNVSATTITVKAGTGLSAGGTITSNGLYTVSSN